MSIRGAVGVCVVLVSLMAFLVERSQGHITFFSPKELLHMREQQEKKDMKPRSEEFDEVILEQVPQRDANTDKTLELGVRFSPRQLTYVAPVIKEIIHEIVEEHQKGTVCVCDKTNQKVSFVGQLI
ncbi:motilin-like isoform X2 [Oryzias latipes]